MRIFSSACAISGHAACDLLKQPMVLNDLHFFLMSSSSIAVIMSVGVFLCVIVFLMHLIKSKPLIDSLKFMSTIASAYACVSYAIASNASPSVCAEVISTSKGSSSDLKTSSDVGESSMMSTFCIC